MFSVRRRFWVEAVLGAVSAVLLIVTAAIPTWIEAVFGVEPDGGDGSLEWLLVAVVATAAVGFGALARVEWRRAHAAGQSASGG